MTVISYTVQVTRLVTIGSIYSTVDDLGNKLLYVLLFHSLLYVMKNVIEILVFSLILRDIYF